MNAGLEAIVSGMTEEQRATLAAEILSTIDPSEGNLTAFFDALSDGAHTALVAAAEDEPERG